MNILVMLCKNLNLFILPKNLINFFDLYRNNVFGSSIIRQPIQKKKPPPRPPPPKFNQNYSQTQREKYKKSVC